MSDQSTHPESPVIPDEAVQAAARALVLYESNGCCDEWPKPCADCDCFRDKAAEARAGMDRARAHHALAAAVPALHAAWAEAEDRGERVSRALSHHWVTSVEWGGERRNGCAKCRYMDGVHYLWPCPTVQALTGCEAPDPLPQDRARRAEVEALLALGAVTETKEDQK